MASQRFLLAGVEDTEPIAVDISAAKDLDALKLIIAGHFHVVRPSGIGFISSEESLDDLESVKKAEAPISITIDGHSVRGPPGPPGLPVVGNYFEIFPDHLGNHQRLFDRYGPIFHTTNMGRTVYQVNDPELAEIAFTESDFFTKDINQNHPLYPIRNELAGVFLGNTDTNSWRIVHKFMPPALGPKAVRHYAPIMNGCIDTAIPVFDTLEAEGHAWNVYQYMVKLASTAIAKVVLGMNFDHFTSADAPLDPMVAGIAEALSLNKKIASKGDTFAKLPFGDAKKLHEVQTYLVDRIGESIANHASSGNNDLPLQDAALDAANMIDYFCRATDSNGQKLPKENLVAATIVASGAGFVTTATLLSWLIYGLVNYPDTQTTLLQELVDAGFTGDEAVTPEVIENLTFLDKYVKETQRLHNPSYQPGRTARTDLILPGGYQLHEGDVVIAAIHHIHQNAKHWHDPKRFDPNRWDTEEVKNRHKAAYCPFAMGQRGCIGFNFALQEVKIFLPKLVWRYEWFKEGETAVEYDPFFQLVRPVNLYVRTKQRTVWPSKSNLDQW